MITNKKGFPNTGKPFKYSFKLIIFCWLLALPDVMHVR